MALSQYACPVCADAFASAWARDEHFDAFHNVLDGTLLPHDQGPIADPPTFARALPHDDGPIADPPSFARAADVPPSRPKPTPGPRSKHRYIYFDSRKNSNQWYVQMPASELGGAVYTSYSVATEEDALHVYAAEARRRGMPDERAPLRYEPRTQFRAGC
jgi:hypothetical protein